MIGFEKALFVTYTTHVLGMMRVLLYAGFMLSEHRFTGFCWDVPRMNQTEWLNQKAKKGTDCWGYSGASWLPAKIIDISQEYGVRVS